MRIGYNNKFTLNSDYWIVLWLVVMYVSTFHRSQWIPGAPGPGSAFMERLTRCLDDRWKIPGENDLQQFWESSSDQITSNPAVSWSWAWCLNDFFWIPRIPLRVATKIQGEDDVFFFRWDGISNFWDNPVWVGDLAHQLAMKGPPKAHGASHWNGHILGSTPIFIAKTAMQTWE